MTRYIDNLVTNLRSLNAILGYKIKFEAEVDPFGDLIILKQIVISHNIPVYLKIGGVKAINDMKQAKLLNINGIIAPMVESPSDAYKFV